MQPLTASVERGVITLMKEKGGEGQGWWDGGTSTHLRHSLRSWCVLFVFLGEEVADQPTLGPAREERFAVVVAHLLANRQQHTISHRLHTEKRDYCTPTHPRKNPTSLYKLQAAAVSTKSSSHNNATADYNSYNWSACRALQANVLAEGQQVTELCQGSVCLPLSASDGNFARGLSVCYCQQVMGTLPGVCLFATVSK